MASQAKLAPERRLGAAELAIQGNAEESSLRTAQAIERRACNRVPRTLPIGVRFGATYHLAACTANISRNGILFHTDIEIPAGAQIELVFPVTPEFFPSQDVWLRCEAEVIRAHAAQAGGEIMVAAALKRYVPFSAPMPTERGRS